MRRPPVLSAALAGLLLAGCCNPCPCTPICDPCASCAPVAGAPRPRVVPVAPPLRVAPPAVAPQTPPPTVQAQPPSTAGKAVPYNATCPVMLGNPVNPDITTVWDGKVVGFCSETCRVRFLKDPAKYAKNLP